MEPFNLGSLAVWHHIPADLPARARVLHIHGISEHSGRHLNTVEALLASGIEIVRFDLRGMGKSGGRRQWVAHFEDYVHDTTRVFNWIHRSLPRLPLFIFGHSLGGAIGTHFAALYGKELRGVVLSAPAFQVGSGVSAFKIALGKVLRHLAPTMMLPDFSDNNGISRDPEVVKAYRNDPLTCHFATVQQGTEIIRALGEMPERAREIRVPVVIAHGSLDSIIRLEGSFELLTQMPSHDKTLHILPGGYHEPHNDLGKEEYFSLVCRWMEKRV